MQPGTQRRLLVKARRQGRGPDPTLRERSYSAFATCVTSTPAVPPSFWISAAVTSLGGWRPAGPPPLPIAKSYGVSPVLLAAFTLAPLSARYWMIVLAPRRAAPWIAVSPLSVAAFTSRPRLTQSFTASSAWGSVPRFESV